MEYVKLTTDGLVPVEADVDVLVDQGDERELAAVWNTHHRRRNGEQLLDHLHDQSGEEAELARHAFTEDLAATAPVTAVQALAANRRFVELLTGRRWFVMQAAREAGASWSQIGTALGMSKQGAQDWYRRKIEEQETWVPDFHDRARARAALEDS